LTAYLLNIEAPLYQSIGYNDAGKQTRLFVDDPSVSQDIKPNITTP